MNLGGNNSRARSATAFDQFNEANRNLRLLNKYICCIVENGGIGGGGTGTGGNAVLLFDLTANLGSGGSVGGVNDGDFFPAGTLLEDIDRAILIKTVHPIYQAPTLTLIGTGVNTEIGTVLNPAFSINFTQNDAGAKIGEHLLKNNGNINNSFPYTDTGLVIVDGIINYQATADYAIGPVKNNNLGNPDSTGRISAGTISSNTIVFHGYRNAFYGVPVATVTTSANARALAGKYLNPINGSSFTITIPAGSTYVVFAYPATLEDVNSVKYQELSFSEVKTAFTQSIVSVEAANGVTSINYKVYTYQPIQPFQVDVHYIVTI